jgi:uncharacterized protein involved in exopolysaccharide biosynthesis
MDDVTARRLVLHRSDFIADSEAVLTRPKLWAALIRFLLGFLTVVCVAGAAWPFLPRRFESAAQIVLQPAASDNLSDRSSSARGPADEFSVQSDIDYLGATNVLDAVIRDADLATNPELTEGSGIVGSLKRAFGMPSRPVTEADLRNRLRRQMVVARDRKSYTVKIGFVGSDPVRVTAMATSLVNAYLADQVARKQRAAEAVSRWLAERVRLIGERQEASEKRVSEFLTRSGLIDRGAQVALESLLKALSADAASTHLKVIEVTTRLRGLTTMVKAGTIENAPEVIGSPTIAKLKENLTVALARPTAFSSEQKAITDQIAAETSRIVRSAEVDASVWAQREIAVEENLKKVRAALIDRARAEIELARLQRDSANDKIVLEEALTRLKSQAGAAMAVKPDVEVLATPELPSAPAFPNPLLMLLSTILAGCVGGAAMNWRPLFKFAQRATRS